MEHSKNQVHRSFTPPIIQPSRFVTFVWDNNDINPESLKGLSLRCTNGIIIQSSAPSPAPIPQPVPAPVPEPISTPLSPTASSITQTRKPRSFQPMVTEIPPYIQFKRKNTEGQTDVELNLYNKELELSHAIDTLWVIARSQASKNGRQQTIPNWTV